MANGLSTEFVTGAAPPFEPSRSDSLGDMLRGADRPDNTARRIALARRIERTRDQRAAEAAGAAAGR